MRMWQRNCAAIVVGSLLLVSPGCAKPEAAPNSLAEKSGAHEAASPATDSAPATEPAASDPSAQEAQAAAAREAKPDTVQDAEVKAARAEVPVPAATPASAPEPMPTAAPAQLPADEPLPLKGPDTPQAMPAVVLTQALAERCPVKVGDSFPDLKLPNAAGQEQSLSSLLSPKLTLVFFWSGKNQLSLEQLADMATRYQRRLRPHNVAIIGVSSGDQLQLAGELAQQRGATFPLLCDADGAALQTVTGAGVPCCYLLDASGKVLWFDTEYSPTTRRDLVQAVRFALTH